MKQSLVFPLQQFISLSHLVSILAKLSIKYWDCLNPSKKRNTEFLFLSFFLFVIGVLERWGWCTENQVGYDGPCAQCLPHGNPTLRNVYGSAKCLLAVLCPISSTDRRQRCRGTTWHKASAQGQYIWNGATLPDLTPRSHPPRTPLYV